MTVSYEWDVEVVDAETGDILEHNHANRLVDHWPITGANERLVLVRDKYDYFVHDREWAYVENGKLPEYFEDGLGRQGAKVPKRFHKELERVA